MTGQTYRVLVRTTDRAGNVENVPGGPQNNSSYVEFTYTAAIPVSRITGPAENDHWTPAGATLTGTANEVSIGEEVQLWDITDPNSYLAWTGLLWVSSDTYPNYNAAAYTNGNPGDDDTWTYGVAPAVWTENGLLRRFQLRARALAPTEAPAQGPVSFFVDGVDPQGDFTYPTVGYLNRLPRIRGTATDNADGEPTSQKSVFFRVKRNEDGKYWDFVSASPQFVNPGGGCFSGPEATCKAATDLGGNSFEVTHASFTDGTAFESNKVYTLELAAKDKAGNNATKLKVITWDATPPAAGIARPASVQRINSLPSITGTASDFYSMSATSVSLRSLGKDKCYNGAGSFNQACPYWLETSSDASSNWAYSDPSLNATLQGVNTWYRLLIKPIDTATNENTTYVDDVSSRTFLMDSQRPAAGVSVPADEGNFQSGALSGVSYPITGTVDDPNTPWNSGIRRVSIRISYNDLAPGDTWYWLSGPQTWSSGAVAAVQGMFDTGSTFGGGETNWDYDQLV
ncbi:MAG TPA: hypothetical protein DD417_04735, partial [Elusimicrobia bacterium]|nr:hypothetical protein [Elusimicrobiota bacterium]